MKTPRETSPYRLIQEELRDDPWRLLVAVIMLNQTSAKQARPVWTEFFRRWPTPEKLWLDSGPTILVFEELVELLHPIGFYNRRADRIWKMTFDFLVLRPDINTGVDVRDMHGIGKYGADSYNMFVRGYLVEDVQDKELKNYVAWVKGNYPDGDGEDLQADPQDPVPESSAV